MVQNRLRKASFGVFACAALILLLQSLPRTSSAQFLNLGVRTRHFGFSGSTFLGGSHFNRPSGFFRGGFSSGFHGGYRYPRRSSFFFGLSYGSYYPYYYDPFWYPGYATYPYPVYRTVYVDEPAYVERRYREPEYLRGDDDYYLHRKYSSTKPEPGISEVVADIEQAFVKGDCGLLERHIETKDSIRIYSRDRSNKTVKGSEYVGMTRDAMKDMKTVSYKLDHIQEAGRGTWSAAGIHVIKAENGDEKKFDVNFLLRKSGDRWIIVEAGASSVR